MKIAVNRLDHRNVGSVVTWQDPNDSSRVTSAEILGFTQVNGGKTTVLHTHIGDHDLPGATLVDIQLNKSSMLLGQTLTYIEGSGAK